MRRKDREKDTAFAMELLTNCEYATLATTNPDTTPYCVPISLAVIGEAAYFHCALKGRKLDNILNNASVCLSAVRDTNLVPEKYTTEFESVVAFGKCKIVQDDEERIPALRAICEKYAPGNMENFDKIIARALAVTCVCKIDISEITGKAKTFS